MSCYDAFLCSVSVMAERGVGDQSRVVVRYQQTKSLLSCANSRFGSKRCHTRITKNFLVYILLYFNCVYLCYRRMITIIA